jgi:hypothetical protein
LLVLAAAEDIEQAAAPRCSDLAAAACARERILKLGLPPPVAAATGEGLALLLELTQLPTRILDAIIHLQALRVPDQPAAEDEEALETARILHGCARALKHAVGLSNLLVDAAEVTAIGAATALRRGEVLLELHAADLLVALR